MGYAGEVVAEFTRRSIRRATDPIRRYQGSGSDGGPDLDTNTPGSVENGNGDANTDTDTSSANTNPNAVLQERPTVKRGNG
jgi:hypothetical protein